MHVSVDIQRQASKLQCFESSMDLGKCREARGASPRRQVVPDVDDLDQQLEALNRKLAVLLSMACPSTVEAFMAPDPSRGRD